MDEKIREDLQAIAGAMKAEKKAHGFYAQAAEKMTNPKGKDMFLQMADFEIKHYKNLESLYNSLKDSHKWIAYQGTKFPEGKILFIEGERSFGELQEKGKSSQSDMDVLIKASEDAEKARRYYEEMSEKTDDPMGKEMFKKLAEEEKIHARVLNDQLYSLTNKGIWSWGDEE